MVPLPEDLPLTCRLMQVAERGLDFSLLDPWTLLCLHRGPHMGPSHLQPLLSLFRGVACNCHPYSLINRNLTSVSTTWPLCKDQWTLVLNHITLSLWHYCLFLHQFPPSLFISYFSNCSFSVFLPGLCSKRLISSLSFLLSFHFVFSGSNHIHSHSLVTALHSQTPSCLKIVTPLFLRPGFGGMWPA